MLADAHRQAALDIEQLIADVGDPAAKPYSGRGLIELYWGAAFHWIAYGCQTKHGKHKEKHTKLVSYLRDLGEPALSDVWNRLDQKRAGGWYGVQTDASDIATMRQYWQDIRAWALS